MNEANITVKDILNELELICQAWDSTSSILNNNYSLAVKNHAMLLRKYANEWRVKAGLPEEKQP